MSKLYIGIDPGLDGGVVVLDGDGSITMAGTMPTRKLVKGRRTDVEQLHEMLVDGWGSCRKAAILEDPGGHAPSAAGLRSMSMSFATVETILRLGGTPYHIVNPKTWQSAFWKRPKLPKGTKYDTKAAALEAARRIWPSEDWTVGRGRKPHDGLIDAALIAEWGRRQGL